MSSGCDSGFSSFVSSDENSVSFGGLTTSFGGPRWVPHLLQRYTGSEVVQMTPIFSISVPHFGQFTITIHQLLKILLQVNQLYISLEVRQYPYYIAGGSHSCHMSLQQPHQL